MKFQAFQCECGYNMVSAEDVPKCPDCGKKMVVMDQNTDRYKKFDRDLKKLFGA